MEKSKELICEFGRRVYQRGYVAANDGNISLRLGENEFLVTPTGVSKGYLTPDMIILVDQSGNVLDGNLQPSSETKMHLRIYEQRGDVNGIVHAHPPYATTFAVAGIPLEKKIMPEAVLSLGTVPLAPYGTPATDEVPDSIEEYLADYNGVLLQNHGALTWGATLEQAYFRMETLEFYAQIMYLGRALGVQEISPEGIRKLEQLKLDLGL